MAIKLVGADLSGSNAAAKLPQPGPINELTPTNGFQFAGQQLQQAGQGRVSSIDSQAKMTNAMNQDNALTTENTRVSQQNMIAANAQKPGPWKELSGLADVGKMVVNTLNDVEKRKQAQRKAEQDFNAAQLGEKLSKLEVSAQERARLDPSGVTGLNSEFESLIRDQDISQEDRTKAYERYYGGIMKPIVVKNIDDKAATAKGIRNTMNETTVKRVEFMSIDLIEALKQAPNAEERNTITNRLFDEVLKPLVSGQLAPDTAALVQSSVMTILTKAAQESAGGEGEQRKKLMNINAFIIKAGEINKQYGDDVVSARRAISVQAAILGIGGDIAKDYDPLVGAKTAEEIANLNDKLEAYADKAQLKASNANPDSALDTGRVLSDLVTESDMTTFLANPANTQYVNGGVETSSAVALRNAFKVREKYLNTYSKTAQKLAELNGKKADLARTSVTDNISYLMKLKPEQVRSDQQGISALLQGLPGMDANKYNSIVSGLQSATASADPRAIIAWQNQLGALQQDLQAAGTAQSNAIDEEAKAAQIDMAEMRQQMERYGYKDGKFDHDAYKKLVKKREAEIEANKPVPGVAGIPNNFSRVALATGTSPDTGKQVYLPFKKGVAAPSTSRYGMRSHPVTGEYKMHNGEDLGAPEGTGIIAQLRGKVVENQYQEGGAGNYIRIAYEDGTEHTFMHMQQRSRLAVGQAVQPGQSVGTVGATGIGTGAHLHWEVRNKSGQSMSAYKWAEQYTDTPQRGAGSNVKQTYRSPETSFATRQAPPGSTPIFNGYITGKGANMVVVNYDAQSPQAREARASVTPPTRVDPSKSNRVLMQRTGKMDSNGLENIMVTMYDKGGNSVGQYVVNSGSPAMQGTFGKGGSTRAGSRSPLEYGTYKMGAAEDAYEIPGMRSQFIPITGQFESERSQLGFHFDGDRAIKPGTSGCVVFDKKANFDEFHSKIKKYGLNTVEFSPVRYSAASPLRAGASSTRASKGGGGLDADHGYMALRDQPAFRRELNATAQRLGFNGQWLADAMAGESGFSTSIRERTGRPAVGLIQFYQDRATPGYKTVNGKKYSLDQIGRMGKLEQLKLVENYFIEAFRNAGGRAKSPQDVLGLIWYNRLDKDIPLDTDDGNIKWGAYRNTLGKQVGRKYSAAPPREANKHIASTQSSDRSSRITQQIDGRPRTGCLLCAQMVASNQFVPHERTNALNIGSEIFTYG